MEEDINKPEEEVDFSEIEWQEISPHEDIQACTNALMSVDGMDPQLLSGKDAFRIRQIKRMSLRIIHHHIKDIYSDLFEKKEEQEESGEQED